MKIILLLIGLVSSIVVIAQPKTDLDCHCTVTFQLRSPKQHQSIRDTVSVIVEIEVDEKCVWANPVIIKKGGPGFDEEALRSLKMEIKSHNDCIRKCGLVSCEKQKRTQTVQFAPILE